MHSLNYSNGYRNYIERCYKHETEQTFSWANWEQNLHHVSIELNSPTCFDYSHRMPHAKKTLMTVGYLL